MIINFCSQELTTKIECDKVSFSGFEVENLISRNLRQKQKGFMVEHFIKPPVVINLKFLCEVNVKKIVIGCCVGAQKSAHFEVSTLSGRRADVVAYGSVGSGDRTVVFQPHKDSSEAVKRGESGVSFLSFKSWRNLNVVNGVRVKILRTENSTLSCIGKLEVWGTPSRCVSEYTRTRINSLIALPEPPGEPVRSPLPPRRSLPEKTPQVPEFEIPEEFVDPITCELMTIPMTLPCGKIVDVTTLERFREAEAEWGRTAGDPFTGRLFGETNKPVRDDRLKARIDRYLLEHCDTVQLRNVPRTVGKRCGGGKRPRQECQEANKEPPSKVSSVDDLLSASLEGLPSFLESPGHEGTRAQCFACSTDNNLYKLPCEHLVCRPCLLTLRKERADTCSVCSSPLNPNQAVRFHNADSFFQFS